MESILKSLLIGLGLEKFGWNEVIALIVLSAVIAVVWWIKNIFEKRNKKRNESKKENKVKGGET